MRRPDLGICHQKTRKILILMPADRIPSKKFLEIFSFSSVSLTDWIEKKNYQTRTFSRAKYVRITPLLEDF